jgi:hypothetical protein
MRPICIYEKLCSLHATTFNHCAREMFKLKETVIQAVCYSIQTTCIAFFLTIIKCIRKNNKCATFVLNYKMKMDLVFNFIKLKLVYVLRGIYEIIFELLKTKTKLRVLSPRANYNDRATAAYCRS